MKIKTRLRVVLITGDTAQEFNERITAELERAQSPKITYLQGQTFGAYVEYKETEYIPETLAERYETEGKAETCGACPFLVKTDDKRCVWHYCAQHNRKVKETSHACDLLYSLREATK